MYKIQKNEYFNNDFGECSYKLITGKENNGGN